MIPEIGQFTLILALGMAIIQAVFPLIGAARGIPSWVALAKPAARAQLLFMALAFACLTYAFIVNDFSVTYVAHNSNTALPLMYRISAVWGAHEGSLLLWGLILALWTGAVTVFSRSIPHIMLARVLAVMGLISIGFILFMLFTSNPFARLMPAAMEGRDLNPLLQDPGLIIHPPMLYMGYVGFSVAFAFAIAAMLGGRLDSVWARWSRPWTIVAWVFLTAGITLGSWWAYYELGWGGWWFWDPVENASFMPWLVGTALMHSLAVSEKRAVFKAWTVLLAIFAFSLSLLGTFLVRSGVLTSVHAFATDPERGLFILIFLIIVVGGSLTLYAWRAPLIRSSGRFALVSREMALLMNNIFLLASAAMVLVGTLYPLVIDALGLGKVSVGPPYFNLMFSLLMIPLAILVGYGAISRWKQDDLQTLARKQAWPLLTSVVLGPAFVFGVMPVFHWSAAFCMMLAFWVVLSSINVFYDRIKTNGGQRRRLGSLPLGFYGMSLAHMGIGVFITGVALTTIYSSEKDVRLAPGERYTLGGYVFQFEGVKQVAGPNYQASEGHLIVTHAQDGQAVAQLHPQKRIYRVQRSPMTEAAIDAGLTRDLFVALGEPLGAQGAWSVRLYHKPFIRWIWLGAIFMVIGGLLAAADRRYRLMARRDVKQTLAEQGATAAP